jgi:hypothetical protein
MGQRAYGELHARMQAQPGIVRQLVDTHAFMCSEAIHGTPQQKIIAQHGSHAETQFVLD